MCRLTLLLSCLGVLSGSCVANKLEDAAEQRLLGETTINSAGLGVTVYPGTILSADENARTLDARLNAGLGQLVLDTNERASGAFEITIENVHKSAVLEVRLVETLPFGSGLDNICSLEAERVDINCVESPSEEQCRAIPFERPKETTIVASLPLDPCLKVTYQLALPEAQEMSDTSFVVIGSTRSPDTISEVVAAERAADRAHDFYILLGDALAGKDNAAVDELITRTRALDEVFIAIPGAEELGADSGLYFARHFGDFAYHWSMKQTQFVSFYSARRQLTTRGLINLESSLRAMETEDRTWRAQNNYTLPDDEARALPAFAVTHTPPFDPNAQRERGFTSRIEAARAMSLLGEYAIDTLFAGGMIDTASVDSTPRLRVTTAQDTRISDLAEYIIVELSHTSFEGSRAVGNQHIKLTHTPLPQ